MSDQTIACQDQLKIKQLQTRTNKISGFTNWAFTLAYGFAFDQIKSLIPFESLVPKTNQAIGDSGNKIYTIVSNYVSAPQAIDCWDLGYQLGIFVSETLEAKVVTNVPLVEAQNLI